MNEPGTADSFLTTPGGVRLCHRTHGDPSGSPLLLIAGLGLDLTSWPEEMVTGLTARGFYVIRFDNRDAGRSSRIAAPPPGRLRQLTARPRPDAYDLADMAADTVGLLDQLGVAAAHLVGMSMGGMIAQTIAARHPARALTLTSIFSTTGARRVGRPALRTYVLLARPRARTEAQAVAHHLAMLRHIGSPAAPFDEPGARAYAAGAWRRVADAADDQGTARQIGAIQKSGDRTRELGSITAPTLVVHGDRDPMVHPSGGRATAVAVAHARHVTVTGMGHDLAPAVTGRIVDLIAEVSEHTAPSGDDRRTP